MFTPIHCSVFKELADVTQAGDEAVRHTYTAPSEKRELNFRCNGARAAEILGLPQSTFYEMAKLPNAPVGEVQGNNRRLYSLQDLEVFRAILIERGLMQRPPRRREGQPCVTFAISNLKGGVSKTTLATNLASHLALHGYRTLLVDLDPQGSATGILDPNADVNLRAEDTMLGPLLQDPNLMSQVIRPTVWAPLLDLVPAMPDLHYAEMQMFQSEDPENPLWERLRAALRTVEHNYDVILIDTAPSMNALLLGAIWAADWVLMPAQASWVDHRAMQAFFSNLWRHLSSIEEHTGMQKYLAGVRIILSSYRGPSEFGSKEPQRSNIEQTIAGLIRRMMGQHMADAVLPHSPAFRTAALEMSTVHELSTSERTNKRALEAFWELGNEVISMVEVYRDYVENARKELEQA